MIALRTPLSKIGFVYVTRIHKERSLGLPKLISNFPPTSPKSLSNVHSPLQLANDIGNDYKMLVYDLKHNRNEFAHSPHAANDLMALLEAMRKCRFYH